ncbi:Transcriptional regulatory protein LiaR [Oceanobacillus picturae]|uniref:Transcriptional regulatory protein LiaR n=1 Tax=Oceanobacillus picturae TaxID=171693 RepID=W9BB92_9BACI|nr:response regulator transcription factor [Oceanobacillus picturae]CDO03685.1 Transcriptional regulatory protein LiaR [Oceanobacillus picturae]
MIKVMLVEDQRLFSEGVEALISNTDDIQVVGVAANGEEAIKTFKQCLPDVVLMDIHMPHLDGIKATVRIKENHPDTKIILLTTYADEDLIITGINAGADGFLLKSLRAASLIRCIRDVYADEIVLSGAAARILAEKIRNQTYSKKQILDRKLQNRNYVLSKRELDIACLLMDHHTNKQIAEKLYLSEGTIKNYISELYHKFNIPNRKNLINYLNKVLNKKN